MPKNKITDIFFDLDHTLWDFEANSKIAYTKLLKKHKININIEDFIKVYVPVNRQYWEDYAKNLKTKNEVKYGRLTEVFKLLNISISDNLIHLLANEYLIFLQEENILMKGSIEILDYLHERYKLHILTNGFQEVQEHKMKNSGILHYFNSVISSEEVGKLKPHPDVFNYALQKANTFAHNSYMIGDNLKTDILGAKNVGMFVIHYDPFQTNDIEHKIIPKVTCLTEIKELL
jgi:putative hydrolase of the HAD superfamily